MPKYAKQIFELVASRQKYLALLSSEYGIHSKYVKNQLHDWLTRLDLRVYAIESVYQYKKNLTARSSEFVFKRERLLAQLNCLKFNELFFYKFLQVKRASITKGGGKRSLGILATKDSIMQTLFVQIIEPIIDVHADKCNFGFRKGRNPFQAIGFLSKLLNTRRKLYKKIAITPRYFVYQKYILTIDVKKFFDSINYK